MAAALAAREPRQDDPFDRLPTPEQMQTRQAAHKDALAARAAAHETVARIGRLPPAHAAALLRLSADQCGTFTPTLKEWEDQLYRLDRLDRLTAGGAAGPGRQHVFEQYPGITAAGEMLTALHPPDAEATPRGTHFVRGDEDEIKRKAEHDAAAWTAFYSDHPAQLELVPAYVWRERMDPRWHRRRIRREALRAGAYWDTALRLARPATRRDRPASPYVSGYTYKGWQQRRERATIWSAGQVVCFDDGSEPVPLATVQANAKKSARARMYALVKAMEHAGEIHQYTAFFITLTLPGVWHAVPAGKRAVDGTYPGCRDNKEWTPEHGPDAQRAELQRRWSLIRARLAKRRELREYFGILVPEPHLDGTQHCHAMLWIPTSLRDGTATEDALRTILDDIAPNRESEIAVIRKSGPKTASPASYVMKYVLKSLDGDQDADTFAPNGEDHLAGEKHERYRAWAAARGLRRMRLVGVHGGMRVWQRLWTAKTDEPLPPRATLARAAIQCGRAAGTAATDPQLTDTERADARVRQNAAYADALGVLGALRCMSTDKGRLRLEYEDTESEHGRPTRREVGVKGQAWDVKLRRHVDDGERFPLRLRIATLTSAEKHEGAAAADEEVANDNDEVSIPNRGQVTVVANGPSSKASTGDRELDCDEKAFCDDTERLISERETAPEWQQWCADRRLRLARLRRPPPAQLAA